MIKDDYDDLVLQIYQASVHPDTFRGYLAELGARLGGHIVALHSENLARHEGAIVLTAGIEESELVDLQQRYAEFADQNLWMKLGGTTLMAHGYADSAHVCDHREMAKTPYFRNLLAPIDIDHSMGILLSTTEGGGQAILTINRSGVRRPFTPNHHALVQRLRPHLCQAFRMLRQRSTDQGSANMDLAALSLWPDPCLIVDDSLSVRWKNTACERHLEMRDLPISVELNQLKFRASGDELRLVPMVLAAATLGRPADRVMLSRDMGAPIWMMSVLGYPAATLTTRSHLRSAALLIFRSDGGVPHDAQQRLSQLLRLTASEARLALALRTTRDLRLAADQCGISWHTARTQIKTIMSKAKTTKQTQLLRLLDLCLDLP